MSSFPRVRDTGNLLLDRLPKSEFAVIEPALHSVELTIRQVVHQLDVSVTHVYFPTTALLSMLTVLEEDEPVEALTVGREGFLGLPVAMGVEASPHRVIVQMKGECVRLAIRPFREAMRSGGKLAELVNRYSVFALRTAGLGIACNALHPVEARAVRWLLLTHDQAGRDQFIMTHEFWAFMLGVRRQTVSVTAGILQEAGMISYHRGVITVRDRPRLEETACECYATTRRYYDRILG